MNKKVIRLTESDLHRIVKESVNRVLNEVEFGGESLHGNNPEDWYALSQVRWQRNSDKYGDTPPSDKRRHTVQNFINAEDLANGDERIEDKGYKKANRMIDRLRANHH